MAQNWLRAPNLFDLVAPPAWWMRELTLFDNQLVIFPSQKRPVFILARRATRTKGESPHDVRGLSQNPDTLLMATNRLVRVCEILPGTIWDMRVFQKLAAHDIRRLGGPTAVADRLDAMDASKEAAIRRIQDDELTQRSRAGYRDYKTRVGERLSLAKSQGRGTLKKKPVSILVSKPSPPPALPTLT